MSRRNAFIVLSLLAVTFAVLGISADAAFLADVWSHLFWLAAGTLATTFVLEAVLQHAALARRRAADAFAFRTFTANMLNALHDMVGQRPQDDRLFEAALSGDGPFEAVAADTASRIGQAGGLERDEYLNSYVNVGGGLRNLSKSYIRLFSASRQEMVGRYRELNDLADQWRYRDEFSDGYRRYTASLPAGGPERSAREAALQTQEASARALVVNTARLLATLAAANATGKDTYRDA